MATKNNDHWRERFIALSKHVAGWSKDPRAKVGVVLVDSLRRPVALGFNGFPYNVQDDNRLHSKEEKNYMVVHAEVNAVLTAGNSAKGGTLYVYGKPVCSHCAGIIIQAGIKQIIAEEPNPNSHSEWDKKGIIAKSMFLEAGVQFDPLL